MGGKEREGRGGEGRQGKGKGRGGRGGEGGLCRTHRIHQPHTRFTHPHSSTHSCAHMYTHGHVINPYSTLVVPHPFKCLPSLSYLSLHTSSLTLHSFTSHSPQNTLPHHHSRHSSLHLLPHNTPLYLPHHTLLTPYSLTSHLFH